MWEVYELEDVKKRTDETIDACVDRIHQLAHCALMGDGSDAAVEFEVQCRLIYAIPDGDIELQKELLKVNWDKGVSYLLEMCCTYYVVESGAAAMCAGKTINTVQNSHWPQKQPQKHPSQCYNCTCQHPLGCDNFPARKAICRGSKKGHWQAKHCSSKKNQSTTPVDSQSKRYAWLAWKEGKKADLIGVHTEEPPCDEIFLDDVHASHTNEAYTTVHLPASASSKGMGSLWVKVDTGPSGSVKPLCLFRHLYPNCIDKTVTQLASIWAALGLLPKWYLNTPLSITSWAHHLAAWFPQCTTLPDKLLLVCGRYTWSCHIGDPFMWGIGSCQNELCCQGHPRHSHQTGPTPAPATPKKIAQVKSTEDLIKKFPDRFQGIGLFPGEEVIYTHSSLR